MESESFRRKGEGLITSIESVVSLEGDGVGKIWCGIGSAPICCCWDRRWGFTAVSANVFVVVVGGRCWCSSSVGGCQHCICV